MTASQAGSAATPAVAVPHSGRIGTRRRAEPIAVADLMLPLLWLVVYAMLPTSGLWVEAFTDWVDQGLYLEALRSVLASGRSDLIDTNTIGPAYVAAAALVHHVTALGPEESLVALNRISYALSVAGGMLLVRLLVRSFAAGFPLVSLAAQLVLLTLVTSTGTWIWSDVPWSHFFAMALGVAFYVARFANRSPSYVLTGVAGGVLALLALTRSFEFAAVSIAWVLAFAFFAAAGARTPFRPTIPRALVGVGSFLAVAALVHLVTEKRGVFLLYGSNLGHQSADVAPEEIAATPVFVPELVPAKLVQLFVDPCFYAICGDAGDSDRGLWDMPLAIQFPSLALLPLGAIAVAVLLSRAVRKRATAIGGRRKLQLLLEMTIASAGMTIGYVASTTSGSTHLKYGFAREFLLPAGLANVIVVSLAVTALWFAVQRIARVPVGDSASRRLTADGAFLLVVAIAAIGFIPGMHMLRTNGLPQLESRHIGRIAYAADCRPSSCRAVPQASTPEGELLSVPTESVLTFDCGGNTSRFTVYAEEPRAGVRVGPDCRKPRLVAAWPVVMGLPPTSADLRRVDVINRG